MKNISQEIIDYIASYGGTPEELTPAELNAVIEEYQSIQDGTLFLDSVLFGRFPIYR